MKLPMDKRARIYVAGHRGLVGSAIVRRLKGAGYETIREIVAPEVELLFTPSKPDGIPGSSWMSLDSTAWGGEIASA